MSCLAQPTPLNTGGSSLIVMVRRQSKAFAPQTYTFSLDGEKVLCRLKLGERTIFRPPRGPQNGQLTILTVNDQVQVIVENANVGIPQTIERYKLAAVVELGRQEIKRRALGLLE